MLMLYVNLKLVYRLESSYIFYEPVPINQPLRLSIKKKKKKKRKNHPLRLGSSGKGMGWGYGRF